MLVPKMIGIPNLTDNNAGTIRIPWDNDGIMMG